MSSTSPPDTPQQPLLLIRGFLHPSGRQLRTWHPCCQVTRTHAWEKKRGVRKQYRRGDGKCPVCGHGYYIAPWRKVDLWPAESLRWAERDTPRHSVGVLYHSSYRSPWQPWTPWPEICERAKPRTRKAPAGARLSETTPDSPPLTNPPEDRNTI